MGTITAQAIIDKAAIQLIDIGNIRWTRAELLAWLNEAQQTIVLALPQATATTTLVTTVAGAKQSIPADGWLLLKASRNMGTNGTTPGRSLVEVTHDQLSQNNPNWISDAGTASANVYYYLPVDRTTFWIYPPANSSGNRIEVIYSKQPTVITSESGTIDVADVYAPALLNYVLYRACMKDAEYAPGVQLSSQYLNIFMTMIDASKTRGDATVLEAEKS